MTIYCHFDEFWAVCAFCGKPSRMLIGPMCRETLWGRDAMLAMYDAAKMPGIKRGGSDLSA